jgi:hypothetical protein
VAVADFTSDVVEALMILDEIVIERERIVTLGLGIAGSKNRKKGKTSSSSFFLPAQFDECEYLGGNSKVAALVECLDNLIASSSMAAGEPMLDLSSNSSSVALPPLAESQLAEVRRLRQIVSQKVPVAEAVAAEQRRKTSPRSSPRAGSAGAKRPESPPPAANKLRRPRLALNPSGGVLRNGSAIKFVLSQHLQDMVNRGSAELLVSVSSGGAGAAGHTGGDPASRVFKSHDLQPLIINIGRHAPGWAEVHAFLRDVTGKLTNKQQHVSNESADESDDGSFARSVLCATTARFYVVTHGPSDSTDKKKMKP